MTLTRTTPAAAGAYATALAGRSRDHLPVPWTADPGIDDCARFCSHVLWGGKPGPISWVDNFQTAGDGAYASGAADLRPWDVLLFDWEGNGVGNHVEFMVADLGNGYVRTYGANGADTRAAAYRLRPKRYIMGRFRPRWQTAAAPTPQSHLTPTTTPRRPLVYTFVPIGKTLNVVSLINGKRAAIRGAVPGRNDHELLRRWRDNDGSDEMLPAEADIVRGYLRKIA
ncbi:hypothetical protein [Curtobacterium flaccumfaciens]|uniref:hypothetical protein n=1 Tax=Curtobacterium flaccumfaciens TaxID=2035 RepID=UPI001BDDFD11|nr:hypothetical protein [Curtobacterium flaccumfaciens]MBT1633757.1 hypothetical protein [Curtobacterium flaccumfaciens pv. oortii]MCX2845561.1 hypothetical protein [Curtobacterium flaccumfaciens pv. oortii]